MMNKVRSREVYVKEKLKLFWAFNTTALNYKRKLQSL
jgi:hypothetical protein